MPSLRSTAKLLDPASQVISMRKLAQIVSLQPPVSLRYLNELASNRDSLLIGYKISTGMLGTDHTYVTSDKPSHAWPCWGRESGGKEICRGYGKFQVANCISQALPLMKPGTAGIIYGVTGVCHQTANRILYPAGVTVSKAGGYWLSTVVYGIYGTTSLEFFTRLAICKASLHTAALKKEVSIQSIDADMKVQSNPIIDEPEKEYIKKIVALYTEQMQTAPSLNSAIMSEESSLLQESKFESVSSMITNEERYSLLGKELELMLRFHLGDNLDTQIIKPVLKQQSGFLMEKEKMDREFYNAGFNIENYVKDVNNLFGDILINFPDIMGKSEYERIFNLSPSEKGFILIDPDIAVKAHKQI
ncbi:MAG: hypothetical protein ACPK85_08935 [Methanosarcina sp.]